MITKNLVLTATAGLVVLAAVLGAFGLFGPAFSVGLASIGLFMVSTQVKV